MPNQEVVLIAKSRSVNPALIGKDWVWVTMPDNWGAGRWTQSMLRSTAIACGYVFTEPKLGQQPVY